MSHPGYAGRHDTTGGKGATAKGARKGLVRTLGIAKWPNPLVNIIRRTEPIRDASLGWRAAFLPLKHTVLFYSLHPDRELV